MRFFLASVLFLSFLFLVGLNGCKEGCTDVNCAPAPPLLTVLVRDTITELVPGRGVDTLTGDSIDVVDTVEFIRPTTDVLLTLHPLVSGVAGAPFDTVRSITSDTVFLYDDRSRIPSGEFALVAARGSRADTITALLLKHVDGCCGYDVVGSYAFTLGRN